MNSFYWKEETKDSCMDLVSGLLGSTDDEENRETFYGGSRGGKNEILIEIKILKRNN